MPDFADRIIYADNHLLAVNKLPGVPTQPPPEGGNSLETQAKAWVKVAASKPGEVYLHAAHRLDRVASGIVLFARTSKALSRLQEQVRKQEWTKLYHALVAAAPPAHTGELVHFLRHGNHRAEVVSSSAPEAKRAVLRYRLLQALAAGWLVEIELETGRYHQIRAQLAAIGCPILGDQRYGCGTPWPGGNIALHHRVLELVHPVRREPLPLLAPYPAGWPP